MLTINRLTKTYAGGIQALKYIDLTVPSGLFGLLGPNGSGKTTLMKILATLLEPDSGSAVMDQIDLIANKDKTRRILGYLPQEFGLYLLFFLGVICFYTGEAMFRDRELRVEPLLWSTPAADPVFLFSKMIATLGLTLFLVLVSIVTTVLTQILRGQTPVDIWAYISIHGLILIPGLIFMTTACTALNVVLREKYLAYATVIALSGGLFYLYTQGFNHWLYNPVLYGLWSRADFQNSTMIMRLAALRGYTLGLAFLFVLITHLFFSRPRSKRHSG